MAGLAIFYAGAVVGFLAGAVVMALLQMAKDSRTAGGDARPTSPEASPTEVNHGPLAP